MVEARRSERLAAERGAVDPARGRWSRVAPPMTTAREHTVGSQPRWTPIVRACSTLVVAPERSAKPFGA